MTYRSPGVEITQELLRSSQNLGVSTLLPCLVGSLNQVVTDAGISLVIPGTGIATPTTFSYPNLKPGAAVKIPSVKIKVKNCSILIKSGSAGAGIVFGSDSFTGSGFDAVKPGDLYILSGNSGTYVIESATASALKFTSTAFLTTTAQTYTIVRNVGDVFVTPTSPSYTASGMTVSGLTYNTFAVIGGTPVVSYVALRSDMTGFYSVENPAILQADMDVSSLNPLGYCLGIAMMGASGGKTALAYITPDESLASYEAAFSFLATRKDLYQISTLNTSSSVAQALAAHANLMSQPDPSYFRAALVPAMPSMPLTKTLISGGLYTKS